MSQEYTGHGENTGGLQLHSVGELYPFTIEVVGNLDPPKYRWRHLNTDAVGMLHHEYSDAVFDLDLCKHMGVL